MSVSLAMTITRASNGSVDLRPSAADAQSSGIEVVVVHVPRTGDLRAYPIDGTTTVTIDPVVPPIEAPAAAPAADASARTAEEIAAEADGSSASERRKKVL